MNATGDATVTEIVATECQARSLDTVSLYLAGKQDFFERPLWFDVELEYPPSGTHDYEEAEAIRIAQTQLASRGIEVEGERWRVLHCREFRFDPEHPYEVQRSKLYLVMVGEHYLVSLHDGSSRGIEVARSKLAQTNLISPLNIVQSVVEHSLESLTEVEVNFHRFIGLLLKKVPNQGLTPEELSAINSIMVALSYITRRLHLMGSLVLDRVEQLLGSPSSSDKHRDHHIDSLSSQLTSHIATCTQYLTFIGNIQDLNRAFLAAQLLHEQKEGNRLQALAEEHQRRQDARWQILGGVSVPYGLALGVIDAFNLPGWQRLGVLVCASAIATALLYFRNDGFSWLVGHRRSIR
jgi:hypothetical protein